MSKPIVTSFDAALIIVILGAILAVTVYNNMVGQGNIDLNHRALDKANLQLEKANMEIHTQNELLLKTQEIANQSASNGQNIQNLLERLVHLNETLNKTH